MNSTVQKELQEIVSRHLQSDSRKKKYVGTIYNDLDSLNRILSFFSEEYRGKIDVVAALDGAGFILGGMLARELQVGFVPIVKTREHDRFVGDYRRSVYINHRDEACSLLAARTCLTPGTRVLIVDNWIETGATIQSALMIMEDAGAKVIGIATFGMDKNEKTTELSKDMTIVTIL